MNQSYTTTNVITALKDRLKLCFGARTLSDTSIKLIAEQSGLMINSRINNSASELLTVDSISEADALVPLPSGVYQTQTQAVTAGLNTILLPAGFPDTAYSITLNVFDSDGNVILASKPTNLQINSFDITVAGDGTLTCFCIRNT